MVVGGDGGHRSTPHAQHFIGLVETMNKDYNHDFLGEMVMGFLEVGPLYGEIRWNLCGVKQEILEVETYKQGKFILRLDLWDVKPSR
jgi:hypothetical protein